MAGIRMTLFRQVYVEQRISLLPGDFKKASADMDAYLLEKIRKRMEGVCCTHGYVKPGSTQILSRSMGQAEHCRFTGDFQFHCKVKLSCLLPEAGQTMDVKILKVNKLGAYALVVDEGTVHEAMRILIPRDLHLGNTAFDALAPNQTIRVRLLRSRFQANDPFIQAVGSFDGPSSVSVTGPMPPLQAESEAPVPKPNANANAKTEAKPDAEAEDKAEDEAEAEVKAEEE